METMTGVPASQVSRTSRRITSEAVCEPPGLSTRNTTARTAGARRAARDAAPTVSEPVLDEPETGERRLGPLAMAPRAVVSATCSCRPGAALRAAALCRLDGGT